MTELETRLVELWAEDAPPGHDPAFVIAVMERAETRRLWLELGGLVPWVIAASAMLWATAPLIRAALQTLLPPIGAPITAAAVASLAMAVWLWTWVGAQPSPFEDRRRAPNAETNTRATQA
ncbi:MAG: hypothetical protein ACHP7N_06760 [Caulobacterales bacterium]